MINGMGGDNHINGGPDDDVLNGAPGSDTMTGAANNDTFTPLIEGMSATDLAAMFGDRESAMLKTGKTSQERFYSATARPTPGSR